MTATPPDTGMGPETPFVTTRSIRRTRRLTIVGALALVLVAGAVLVGVTTTGARSGSLSSTATKVNTSLTCSRSWRMEDEEDYNHPLQQLWWTIPSGTPAGTTFSAYQRTGTSPTYTYSATLGSWKTNPSVTFGAIEIEVPTGTPASTYVITWGASSTGDLYFSEVLCPAS
jgi:hypothetical protein